MEGEERAPVPKFSSFKLKAPIVPKQKRPPGTFLEEEEGSRRRKRQREDDRSQQRNDDRKNRHHRDANDPADRRSKARNQEEHESRQLVLHPFRPNTTEIEALSRNDGGTDARIEGQSDRRLFKPDVKGDSQNLTLRTIAGKVPPFQRIGFGRVLGAPGFKIDRLLSDNRQTILNSIEDSDVRQDSPLELSSIKNKYHLRLIRPDRDPRQVVPGNFIPLTRNRKREISGTDQNEVPESTLQEQLERYKSKSNTRPDNVDSCSDHSSDYGSEDGEDPTEPVRTANARLEQLVTLRPNDLLAWLSLIDHQEAMVKLYSPATSTKLNAAEQRTLAEIRLSIYDEALKQFEKHPEEKEQLWLGKLKEGAKIWESRKLQDGWHKALLVNSNGDVALWTAYLDYIQAEAKVFEYSSCKDKYLNCLEMLKDVITKGHKDDSSKLGELCRIQLHVFLRLTNFIKEAGYHELAQALWQAFLEFQFHKPTTDNATPTTTDLLSSFEEFWDSEVPRIGELNARGWLSYAGSSNLPTTAPPIHFLAEGGNAKTPKDFAAAEASAAMKLQRPGRVEDDVGDDDPYHIIVYSDIKDCLVLMAHDFFRKDDIVQAFVCYLGLPAIPMQNMRDLSELFLDPFLWRQPVSTTETIVAAGYRNYIGDLLAESLPPLDPEQASWILHAFYSLLDAFTDGDDFAEYCLLYLFHSDPSNIRKHAKRIMKTRRNSIRLGRTYALILGNPEIADQLLSSLIVNELKRQQPRSAIMLVWRSWIWDALNRGDAENAIHRLLSIGEDPNIQPLRNYSSVRFMQVKTLLENGRQQMLHAGQPRLAVVYSELLALLIYVCGGSNSSRNLKRVLSPALESFKSSLNAFESAGFSKSIAHEELHQSRAQLLFYHVQHTNLVSVAMLNAVFEESLAAYQNNTLFMAGCVMTKGPSINAVQPLLTKLIEDPKTNSVVNTMFHIQHLLIRPATVSPDTILNSTPRPRAAFERSAEYASTKHCPTFWQAWLLFEVEVAEKDNDKLNKRARDVFFRGLANVPWCKWYVMLAFEHLGDAMDKAEMKSLARLFEDRGLRMHLDVEKWFDSTPVKQFRSNP
jgi:NRDE-2, necessary for RNA interference